MHDLVDRVATNPSIMLGKPVIKGTRIPIELLLRKLGEGASIEDLLDAYPNLARDDIHAALIYAARRLAHEETVSIPTARDCRGLNGEPVPEMSSRAERGTSAVEGSRYRLTVA